MHARLRGLILLCAASALWGGTVVPTKWLLLSLSPTSVAALRFLVASAVLLPWALWTYHRRYGFAQLPWRSLLKMGLTGIALNFPLAVLGTKLSSGVHVSLLAAALPLTTSLISGALLRERVSRRQWSAYVAATVGVVLVIWQPGGGGAHSLLGDLLLLLSNVLWALYTTLGKRWQDSLTALPSGVGTAWVVSFGAFFLLPGALLSLRPGELAVLATLPGVLAALYLGVGASALAWVLWDSGLTQVPASVAGLTLNLEPLAGVAASILFLGEHVSATALVGGLLSIGAVVWSARAEGVEGREERAAVDQAL